MTQDSRNFMPLATVAILFSQPLAHISRMDPLRSFVLPMSPRWVLVVAASALGIAAATLRAFESEQAKTRRVEMKKQKELRVLAERIFSYGQTIHRQFPTGDVVVGERDLAEQLRKRPEAVVTALSLLLNEQKIQRAPLNGYWKLNS
jgi:hypothetical protein